MQALDELGRPDAPRGSREWGLWYAGETAMAFSDARTRVYSVQSNLRSLKAADAHLLLTKRNGSPFRSWDEFCNTPRPFGLGIPFDVVEALLAEEDGNRLVVEVQADVARTARERTRAAAANPETGKVLAPHRPKEVDKLSTSQSDRAEAGGVGIVTQRKLDALARQAPDLLEAVKDGRMSAHAAALEAGIVKPPDNLTKARKAVEKLTDDELREFTDWFNAYL